VVTIVGLATDKLLDCSITIIVALQIRSVIKHTIGVGLEGSAARKISGLTVGAFARLGAFFFEFFFLGPLRRVLDGVQLKIVITVFLLLRCFGVPNFFEKNKLLLLF
jgi:hypothetical protein